MKKINSEKEAQNQSNNLKAEEEKAQVKSTNRKARKNKYNNLWFTLILIAASFITLLIDRWQTGAWRTPAIVFVTVIIVIAVLFILFRRYVKQVLNKLRFQKFGLGTSLRFFTAGILSTLFALYVLIPNPKVTVPSGLQFNVIVTSATLGGLVLAGASNRRIPRKTHNKFMSVAKKLIYATILFLVFTVLLFWTESTGGIDTNTLDISREGIIRGVFFYGGALSFYAGIFLFSIALIDLALAIRNIGKHK
jgi:hypothetical protein